MVFGGLFLVEREEKRLIKHGRTALQTLRLRYRPNNVQRAPWCTNSLCLPLSCSILSLFSVLSPSISFALAACFLRPDFAPPRRLEKLLKVESFIPMSGKLSSSFRDWHYSRVQGGEGKRETDGGSVYKKGGKMRLIAGVWVKESKDEEMESMCVTHLAQQESRGRTSRW